MECLAMMMAGHFSRTCREVSSSSPHAEQTGSVRIFIANSYFIVFLLFLKLVFVFNGSEHIIDDEEKTSLFRLK